MLVRRHSHLMNLVLVSILHTARSSYKVDVSQTTNGHRYGGHNDGANFPGSHSSQTVASDESKLRLALLVDDKIDTNKDGLVQLDELVGWLKVSQHKYARADADRLWSTYRQQVDGRGTLGWKDYADKEYDHLVTIAKHSTNPEQVAEVNKSLEYHLKRDQRRWRAADTDQDGRLSHSEFRLFLHPEHSEALHWLLVEERFESLDEDKDGRISAHEFLASLRVSEARAHLEAQESWLSEQRLKFHRDLDVNSDNHLDAGELGRWMRESRVIDDQSIIEAQQLMRAADDNHDHRLSKEEILAAYQDFVDSHATDFGESLRPRPEELSRHEL